MIMKTTKNGSVDILSLNGRFDAHAVPPIRQWLDEKSNKNQPQIVVGLEGVHFADSAALSTLLVGFKNCRKQGGDLILCGLQQPVHIIFELTRFDQVFQIFDSESEALATHRGAVMRPATAR